MNVDEFQHIGNQIARKLETEFRQPPVSIIFTASAKHDKAQMVIEVQVTSSETVRERRCKRVLPGLITPINLEKFIKQCVHKFLRGQ